MIKKLLYRIFAFILSLIIIFPLCFAQTTGKVEIEDLTGTNVRKITNVYDHIKEVNKFTYVCKVDGASKSHSLFGISDSFTGTKYYSESYKEIKKDSAKYKVTVSNKETKSDKKLTDSKITDLGQDEEQEGEKIIHRYNRDDYYTVTHYITKTITATSINKQPQKFNVSFNTDGGSAVNGQIVEKGQKVAVPETPQKEGYNFIGWFLNDEKFNFENAVVGNLTLTAKWEKVEKAVTPVKENKKPKVENNTVKEDNIKTATPEQKPVKKKNLIIYFVIGGILLLTGFGIFIFLKFKSKNRYKRIRL